MSTNCLGSRWRRWTERQRHLPQRAELGRADAGAAGEGGMTDEGSVTDGADQADTGNVQSDQSDAGTGEAEVQ